jgi:hypothetical protein
MLDVQFRWLGMMMMIRNWYAVKVVAVITLFLVVSVGVGFLFLKEYLFSKTIVGRMTSFTVAGWIEHIIILLIWLFLGFYTLKLIQRIRLR